MIDSSAKCSRWSVAALAACVCFLGAPVAPAAKTVIAPKPKKPLSHPCLETGYDAGRNLPLAACSAGTLTERDLLFFRLMKRERNPDIFHQWEEAGNAKARARLRKRLEAALRELAFTFTLAERASQTAPTPLDEKYVRYLKYPIYQLVWIERVLKPALRVEQIDLIKYYHDHVEQFYEPESVRVRYIFRKVPPGATIAERDALENEMKQLRARIAAGGDFVELARENSDAPSAVRGGELPLIHRGTFVEEFESQAFALEPGQLSPVFWGPGGLYLVQCIEKFPERQKPFDDVKDEIRKKVEAKTLKFLYDHRLKRLLFKQNYRLMTGRFTELPPGESLILVGPYSLSKDDLLEMFPYVIDPPLKINNKLISQICAEILRGEIVAQQVEQLGLADDPLLREADRIARRIRRADSVLRAALAVPLDFTDEQVRAYYEKNRERLGYQALRRVLRIEAEVTNPYLRVPSQLEALRSELLDRFKETVARFHSAFLEERSQEAQERALAGEAPATPLNAALLSADETSTQGLKLRRLLEAKPRCLAIIGEASTSDYEFKVSDLGFISPNDSVYPYVKGLREGEYSRISATRSGGYQCYFVERYIPGAAVPYEKARVHARQQYIASLQAEALKRLRAELQRQAALQIRLPELSGNKSK